MNELGIYSVKIRNGKGGYIREATTRKKKVNNVPSRQ